jgi:hypothetical protein
MTEPITCAKCASTQFSLQKRGYDIRQSIIVFIAVGLLVGIVWALAISNEKSINYADKMSNMADVDRFMGRDPRQPIAYEKDPLLWGGTAFIMAITLLTGFAGSNTNQRVCLGCGDAQILNQ